MPLYQPREHQLEGAAFLADSKSKGVILADDPGAGKTGQVLLAWHKLGLPGPALLIARTNTQAVYIKQAPGWGIQTPLLISGTPAARKTMWTEVHKYSFVMSSLEVIERDLETVQHIKWGLIIVEEAHRLCNRKTVGYATVRFHLQFTRIFLVTGTPMRRGFQNLWALLNICDRGRWKSYWTFLQTFGLMQKNEMGAWEILGIKNPDQLAKAIQPYYLARHLENLTDIPPKNKVLDTSLQLTKRQQQLYNEIRDDMISALPSGGLVIAPTILSMITRLRQVLCTPRILDPADDLGALLKHLQELLEDNPDHHFVVFTPFRTAIPHISTAISTVDSKLHISMLHGGLKAEEVNQRIEGFRNNQGCCICTVAFAESFDLIPARWAFFAGFEWDPTMNIQAEDRLRRIITTYPVTYYYPTHAKCIDEELVLQACGEKASEITRLRSSVQRLRSLLTR